MSNEMWCQTEGGEGCYVDMCWVGFGFSYRRVLIVSYRKMTEQLTPRKDLAQSFRSADFTYHRHPSLHLFLLDQSTCLGEIMMRT